MLTYRVVVSDRARADLKGIYLYVHEKNPRAAIQLIDDLLDRVMILAEAPYAGTAREDLRKGLRYLPIGSYLAFYRIENETVQVLRYLHGARNLSDSL